MAEQVSGYMAEHMSEPTLDHVSQYVRLSQQDNCQAAFVRIVCQYMCPTFFQIASQGGITEVEYFLDL